MMSAENVSGFLTTAKMFGKFVIWIAEPAQVDNSTHACIGCGLSEIHGGNPILFLEISIITHRVDEIIGRVDALEGVYQRTRVEDISGNDFRCRSRSGD
jgi:hypothetical protein